MKYPICRLSRANSENIIFEIEREMKSDFASVSAIQRQVRVLWRIAKSGPALKFRHLFRWQKT